MSRTATADAPRHPGTEGADGAPNTFGTISHKSLTLAREAGNTASGAPAVS